MFYTLIPLFAFPSILSPLYTSLMYINLLSLPLFNFACLFFLSFLSSQHICQVYFHCFIPQLAPCFSSVFQFVLQLVLFLTSRYNFQFPLFGRSVYCILFLLDCFDFVYGCICICVYSITIFIVVINICFYVGLCSSVEFTFFFFSLFLIF